MTTGEKLLVVKNLVVAYASNGRRATAVRNVSLEIAASETLGIVGESGSGKSTVALAIMRLLGRSAVVEGEIVIAGTQVHSADEAAMNKVRGTTVGLVYQNALTALNPVRTVGSQIAEVARYQLGMNRAEARRAALQALSDVGISDAEQRYAHYPHEFSGGMRQRAAIAMALAARPRLLIADEPTTALDVTVKAQILRLLRDLKDRFDMSLIIISHDLEVIREVADKVAVMYNGRIIEMGDKANILMAPRHPYTRDLIESAPSVEMPRIAFIPGMPPAPGVVLEGCAFEPRCRIGHDNPKCRNVLPELRPTNGSAVAACHYPLDESAAGFPVKPISVPCPQDQVSCRSSKGKINENNPG